MAASNKTGFLTLLPSFLSRASMVDSEAAYYGFYPVTGQSNFPFVFNDLYPTGAMFLHSVTSVTLTDIGSGYSSGETPNITFISNDGGTGAAATASVVTGTTLTLGLTKAFPLVVSGTNLVPQGNFVSGATGWLNTSGTAAATGAANVYIFESGLLHFVSTPSTPSVLAYKFIPSGFSPIIGTGWIIGQMDISGITTGTSRLSLSVRDSGNVGPFFFAYSGITTGFRTVYFGQYLTGGQTCVPSIILTNVGVTTPSFNFTVDNFKIWTGNFDTEQVQGSPLDYITLTPDGNGNQPFLIGTGINNAGFINLNNISTVDNDERGTANLQLNTNWKYFTYGFWHYFVPISTTITDPLTVADFTNGSLIIKNNLYALHLSSNTTISTDVLATSGWHFITVGYSPIDSLSYKAFISVDGRKFSSTINDKNYNKAFSVSEQTPVWHFYGTENFNAYKMGFDEITIWQRELSDSESAEIYNNRAFYPFTGTNAGNFGHISGITVISGGQNYTIAPTIIIDAPTGGGTAATAYANLLITSGLTYAGNFPAFSVGNTTSIISNLSTGTGIFTNNDFLRIGNTIPFENWTIFINFNQTGTITGISQVLLSTMTGVNQQSGFLVGINDSNRLFFEYIDSTYSIGGARRIYVHPQELSAYNIISISQDAVHSAITIANHNLAKGDSFGLTYNADGFINSSLLFIGGFPNKTLNPSYTGFMGRIMDILFLTGAANPVQASGIAPLFFVTGYNPATDVPVYTPFIAVTGAAFISGVIGSGVTGYVLSTVNIPDIHGNNTVAYDNLPLTGLISGDTIVYSTGIDSGNYVTLSGVPEEFFFYDPYTRNYGDNLLVMLSYSVTTGDVVEIYSYTNNQVNTISIAPEAFSLYDFYLSTNTSTDNVNVYNDGLLQIPNIDYVLASGKIISNGLSNFQSQYNYILYDQISGNIDSLAFSGYSGAFTLGGNLTQSGTKDVYLNGQKLISGFDYTISAGTISFVATEFGQPVVWASGVFAFPPARTGNRFVFLGSGIGYIRDFSTTFSGNIMNELFFLNGQRLAPGIDYIVTSNSSLLNASFRSSGVNFPIYTGDIFDASILTTKPLIS